MSLHTEKRLLDSPRVLTHCLLTGCTTLLTAPEIHFTHTAVLERLTYRTQPIYKFWRVLFGISTPLLPRVPDPEPAELESGPPMALQKVYSTALVCLSLTDPYNTLPILRSCIPARSHYLPPHPLPDLCNTPGSLYGLHSPARF